MPQSSEPEPLLDLVKDVDNTSSQLKKLRDNLKGHRDKGLKLREFKLDKLNISVLRGLESLKTLSSKLSENSNLATFNKQVDFLQGLQDALQSCSRDYENFIESLKSTLPSRGSSSKAEKEVAAQKVGLFWLRAEAYECTLAIAVYLFSSESDLQTPETRKDLKRCVVQSGKISGQLDGIRAAIDIMDLTRKGNDAIRKDLENLEEVLEQCVEVCVKASAMVRDEGVNVRSAEVKDALQMIGYVGDEATGPVNVGEARAEGGAVQHVGKLSDEAYTGGVAAYKQHDHPRPGAGPAPPQQK